MRPNVTDLPRDLHRETQAMLPWYVTGRLDAADRSAVDAHLGVCDACRAELRAERALVAAMSALPAAPVPDVEHDWNVVSRTLDREQRGSGATFGARLSRAVDQLRARAARALSGGGAAGWAGLALASQTCVIVVLGVMVQHASRPSPAMYHALSSDPLAQSAEIAVIFRPETTERSIRKILNANAARLVGGPTETDAYLLALPAAERPAALTRLRSLHEVVLAEPLDAGTPR